MSDLRDFTGKNRKFTGTDSIKLPVGTTGQRVNASGNIRFNSTLHLQSIMTVQIGKRDSATISSVKVGSQTVGVTNFIPVDTAGTSTIVIAGSLFDTTNGAVTITLKVQVQMLQHHLLEQANFIYNSCNKL